MTINDERDKAIDFSDPYYVRHQDIIVRENGSFSRSSLEDLSEAAVGAQNGTPVNPSSRISSSKRGRFQSRSTMHTVTTYSPSRIC